MCVLHQPDVTFGGTGHNVAASSTVRDGGAGVGRRMGATGPRLGISLLALSSSAKNYENSLFFLNPGAR